MSWNLGPLKAAVWATVLCSSVVAGNRKHFMYVSQCVWGLKSEAAMGRLVCRQLVASSIFVVSLDHEGACLM